jgi:hypothetical protein
MTKPLAAVGRRGVFERGTMAGTPSAQQSALYILEIYRQLNVRAGQSLQVANFRSYFSIAPWQIGDLRSGLEYAVAQNWVEMTRADNFALTDASAALL